MRVSDQPTSLGCLRSFDYIGKDGDRKPQARSTHAWRWVADVEGIQANEELEKNVCRTGTDAFKMAIYVKTVRCHTKPRKS